MLSRNTQRERAAARDGQPVRRLSWSRLGLLVLVVAGLAGGGVVGVRHVLQPASSVTAPWTVPYVDVTLTPTLQFQDPRASPARHVALAFVVADPADPCTPSWGTYYSLDAAGQDLDLDRRIAQLRAAGGDVTISLGGQANEELAVACTDQALLTDAYRTIVDRYDLASLDLDIEGSAVADRASVSRRSQAVAVVQRERAAEGRPLAVWLTLPVAPSGLTDDGVAVVSASVAAGMAVTGVNVMTMDYGNSRAPGVSMLAATESALEATARQVQQAYRDHGTKLSGTQVWSHIGVTPMIGQNDVDGEVFSLQDADALASYVREHGIGRVSMWSLNRDAACPAAFAEVAVHSNTCSGVTQEAHEFVSRLGRSVPAGTTSAVTDVVVQDGRQAEPDDAATSPYPIWRSDAQYPAGYKVVWLGNVYEAAWYTSGIDPSTVAGMTTGAPWALVGAVTSNDAAPSPIPTVTGVDTPWDPDRLYTSGDRVVLDGLPYQARWTTKGDVPSTSFPVGPDAAWAPLFTLPGEPAGS